MAVVGIAIVCRTNGDNRLKGIWSMRCYLQAVKSTPGNSHHPDISTAKKELQGKVARLLSSKLTIAARADFYTKKDMSQELLKDYKKKLEDILKA